MKRTLKAGVISDQSLCPAVFFESGICAYHFFFIPLNFGAHAITSALWTSPWRWWR